MCDGISEFVHNFVQSDVLICVHVTVQKLQVSFNLPTVIDSAYT
jgi:hypothetical protein